MRRKRASIVNALQRRENGSSLANDQRSLLSYVEDKTARSCTKEKVSNFNLV